MRTGALLPEPLSYVFYGTFMPNDDAQDDNVLDLLYEAFKKGDDILVRMIIGRKWSKKYISDGFPDSAEAFSAQVIDIKPDRVEIVINNALPLRWTVYTEKKQ